MSIVKIIIDNMDIDNPITAVAEIFFPKNNAIALDAMLVKENNKRNYGN